MTTSSHSHPCCSSLEDRVARLEAALAWIAEHTSHLPSNRVAHAALGHQISPQTAGFLAELEADKWMRRSLP